MQHDQHAKDRRIDPSDHVLVHNFAPGPAWLSGEIIQRTGLVSFTAQLSDGRVVRRHQDHLLRRACNHPVSELVAPHTQMKHRVLPDVPTPPSIVSEPVNIETQSTETLDSPVMSTHPQPIVVCESTPAPSTPDCSTHQSASSERRHSTRITRSIV
ncbi:hypothetical protein LSH36_5g08027 [Paralvinella palmiformis]|uniref:Uncharacterized protein n=1 Tax=Paralvinella palmiformis TaxID=53620 RepID=A0AAD9NH91_9ANNE|nr:hypothetical protein LSH36_5g08027 [Paralvinella palmiformis]